MDVTFSYFVFSAAVVIVATLLIKRLAKRLLADEKERWSRLQLIIPEGFTNPFSKESKHEHHLTIELYKRLHELNMPFGIELAVHGLGEEIYFYILARHKDKHVIHHLVETFWSNAYLNEAEIYDLWLGQNADQNHLKAGYFTLRRPFSIPMKLTRAGEFEPFTSILRQLSTLETIGEGAAFQLLAMPADANTTTAASTYLDKLSAGEYHPSKHFHEEFVITPKTVQMVSEKLRSPLFSVNLRLITTAAHGGSDKIFKKLSEQIQQDSQDPQKQYNELVAKSPKNLSEQINKIINIEFDPATEITLNAEEIATYFHLPGSNTNHTKLKH